MTSTKEKLSHIKCKICCKFNCNCELVCGRCKQVNCTCSLRKLCNKCLQKQCTCSYLNCNDCRQLGCSHGKSLCRVCKNKHCLCHVKICSGCTTPCHKCHEIICVCKMCSRCFGKPCVCELNDHTIEKCALPNDKQPLERKHAHEDNKCKYVITHNKCVSDPSDDFIIGQTDFGCTGSFMAFDSCKGAFKAGSVTGTQWSNSANRGVSSASFGVDTIASGLASHAIGESTVASGVRSHAQGYKTNAVGEGAHSEGKETTANGDYSHAEGSLTTAGSDSSHAEGFQTKANKQASHAEGSNTVADGDSSHAEGSLTVSRGVASHSEGVNSNANGTASHAEGSNTIARGVASHSEGSTTLADGTASHAEGINTVASGAYSHVGGASSSATVEGSFAHGENVVIDVGPTYSTAFGKFGRASDSVRLMNPAINTAFYFMSGTSMTPTVGMSLIGETTGTTNMYITGSVSTSSAADFAEYYEWLVDPGYKLYHRFVDISTSDYTKITLAQKDSPFIGITSNSGAIITKTPSHWHNKFLTTPLGDVVEEDDFVTPFFEQISSKVTTGVKQLILDVIRTVYNIIKTVSTLDPYVEAIKICIEGTDVDMTIFDNISVKPKKTGKINKSYDSSKIYIPREQRTEWIPVGVKGQIVLEVDSTCVEGGFVKSGVDGVGTFATRVDSPKARVTKIFEYNGKKYTHAIL